MLSARLHLSPNWDERPRGAAIRFLVLHYTGMPSGASALARLCDPEAKVSAHYLIDEDGTVRLLVPEAKRAWHAGRSAWGGFAGLNDWSVGIELVNPGHEWGYRPFPARQIAALIELGRDLLARHRLPPEAVVAHADIAPNRKEDPGELLDWRGLARHGIGIWPERSEPCPVDPILARRLLARIGYALAQPGVTFVQLVTAFQRRFRPWRVDGALDPETMGRLAAVAALLDDRPMLTSPVQAAGRPLPSMTAGEESPGSTEARCRVMPGGGDPRESATESSLPAGATSVACGSG